MTRNSKVIFLIKVFNDQNEETIYHCFENSTNREAWKNLLTNWECFKRLEIESSYNREKRINEVLNIYHLFKDEYLSKEEYFQFSNEF